MSDPDTVDITVRHIAKNRIDAATAAVLMAEVLIRCTRFE